MHLLRPPLLLVVAAVIHVHVVHSQESSNTETTPVAAHNATYWVSTSNKLWPGSEAKFIVQILVGSDPVTVTVSITYQTYEINSTAKTLLTSAPMNVTPGEPQTLSVQIPRDLKVAGKSWAGYYKIIIVGQGRTVNFKHEGNVYLQDKLFSIFLVTDKAMYKPGQTVLFRALVMEPQEMKVLQEPMDIFITDAKGNRIKQYMGVTGTSGVVDDNLKLAASTPVGDWTIAVTVLGQTQTKTFTVNNYVLPKFEVIVSPPKIPLSSDVSFPIKINAKYTFGQPVTNGTVDVVITMNQMWQSPDRLEAAGWRTKGQLNSDGEFTFEVTIKQLVSVVQNTNNYYYSLDYQQFLIKVNVMETVSQQVQAGSAVMQMYPSYLMIQFLPITPDSYKPGMPYTAYTEVTKADSTKLTPEETSNVKVNFNVTYEVPIPPEELPTTTTAAPSNASDNTNPASIRIGIWHPHPLTKTKVLELSNRQQKLSKTGFASITFNVPAEATSVNIIADLGESASNRNAYKYASAFQSPTNNYLHLQAPLKTPKVGDTITLTADSTEPVSQMNYQVVSKGIVVSNGTVISPVAEGSKTLSFELIITQKMAPSISIFVFYIRKQNSEFVADAVSLSIDGLFQKPVSVEFSKEIAKPGESINLVVTAEPDSTVFILAKDKSVELLKAGNDLTQDMVRGEIAEYSYGSYFPWIRYMFICGWPFSFGGRTTANIIQDVGLIFFTDVDLVHKTASSDFDNVAVSMERASAGMPASSRNDEGGFKEAERVRKEFLEIWIWRMIVIQASSDGVITIPVTAPDTITTYIASIFSVHQTYGLSVGKDTAEVTIFREMFVSLNPPPYIIRNESYCLTASVFSYYPGEIPIFLRFDSSDQFHGSYPVRKGNGVEVVTKKMAFTDFYPSVAEKEIRSSTFCFTPTVTGDIRLKVSALTNVPGLSDAVEQVILVKPEGVARSNNFPFMVNLTTSFWQREINVSFPPETVADSQKITVSIAGNLMGHTFENVDDLLRKSYGCGEQNMLNLAPSVSALEFFLDTDTVTPEIKQRASDYIISGIQQELTYEHSKTGGFSAFGDKDQIASVWLTSFVVKCFSDAYNLNVKYNNMIGIDMRDVIIRSSLFIISNQNKNGSFTEHGVVFHKEMQGGSAQGEALTAYAAISLHEAAKAVKDNATAAAEFQQRINLAAEFLAGRWHLLTDPFDICITAYALYLVNHTSKDDVVAKMEAIAQTEDGFKFWKRANSPQESYAKSYSWLTEADSMAIEMTSYALLTYNLQNRVIPDALPIIRWLTNQRGPNDGFVSTQDTVIGLQALARSITNMYKPGNYSMTFTVSYIDGDGQSRSELAHVNKASEMLLQNFYIEFKNNAPTSLILTANTDDGQPGPSTVFADVALHYNVKEEPRVLCCNMSHDLVKTDTGLELTIYIVATTDDVKKEPSMSTLEVEIVTGYTVNTEEVAANENVSRVDPYDGHKLVMYYNSGAITNRGTKAVVKMSKTEDALTDAKPRTYTFSDYYMTNCRQTKTYTLTAEPYCVAASKSGICPYVD